MQIINCGYLQSSRLYNTDMFLYKGNQKVLINLVRNNFNQYNDRIKRIASGKELITNDK